MEIQELASGLKFPEGPVAMDDGSVIVVEIAAGRVTAVKPDGTLQNIATRAAVPTASPSVPTGISIAATMAAISNTARSTI
ncbi:MAG: hypothetical protein WDM81_04310 [Rhizomicrobium sp.]